MNTTTATRVVDPVCGMTINPSKAVASSRFNGVTYYFCSRGCEAKFDAAPAQYAGAAAPVEAGGSCCSTGHSCC